MRRRRWAAVIAALTLMAAPKETLASPAACLVEEGHRIGAEGASADICRARLDLRALGGEHVAFQIALPPAHPDGVSIEVEPPPGAPRFELFVEHFVEVTRRSNSRGSHESLAFKAAARPPDEGNVGFLPDALIPVEIAPAWAAYPLASAEGRASVLYAEAFVPPGARAGNYRYAVVLRVGSDTLARYDVELEVLPVALPYRAVRAFAFYERETLERTFQRPDDVERKLVQTLHAHGLDSVTHLVSPSDVQRLRGSFDGSWFTPAAGYRGPGEGVPTSIAPIGCYGMLGEPGAAKIANIRATLEAIPSGVEDVFLYAVDEQCDSKWGPDWRALLQREDVPLRVGHTCHQRPRDQGVDIVLSPAQAFDPDDAAEARALGKRVWIYNGQLPHSGAPSLDVPLTSLTANGWVAAVFDVDRWFYWETIFWNDGNRGGLGPSDVFETAETFHNADGDTSLYDGLLLFPGRMPSAFAAHDIGRDVVLPSLRLKALRRGLEDAALQALAAQVDANATYAVNRSIVRRALDEVGPADASHFDLRAEAFTEGRAKLHDLIRHARGAPSAEPVLVSRALARLRLLKGFDRSRSGRGVPPTDTAHAFVAFFLPVGLLLFGWCVALVLAERRATLVRGSARSQS